MQERNLIMIPILSALIKTFIKFYKLEAAKSTYFKILAWDMRTVEVNFKHHLMNNL